MATTPFFGAQIAGAATLAWLLGGNVPIAIVATFWANPITCPLLWIGSYRIGAWLLGIDDPVTVDDLVRGFGEVAGSLPLHGQHAITVAHSLLAPILKPFGIGAFALGLISAAIAYPVVRLILDRLQAGNLGRAKPADLGLA